MEVADVFLGGHLKQSEDKFNKFQTEQKSFNENICRTVRDNHTALVNDQNALRSDFRDAQTRFSMEIASMHSKQDSLKDLINANERATQMGFEMGATRLNDMQNNHDKDIALLHNHHSATSSRLDLVNNKYHELDKYVALNESYNKTAFNKAFDHINTLEKYRANDAERVGRLEQEFTSGMVSTKMTLDKFNNQLSDAARSRDIDRQRLDRLEDGNKTIIFETVKAKDEAAFVRNQLERKAEVDKQIMNEMGARFRQSELQLDEATKKAEEAQKAQEKLKNDIDKYKQYLLIGTAVGAFLYFNFKRGS